MSWTNLHEKMISEIEKQTKIQVKPENIEKIYQEYLLPNAKLFL
jgi:hypothetical protein